MYPNWIAGDGGPTIVLQSAAAAVWDGTRTSDDTETDYDFICAPTDDGIHVLERHGRHMLVLSDSSWSCAFVQLAGGEIAVLQNINVDGDPTPYVEQLALQPPSSVHEFRVEDPVLRLLVGADRGDGTVYEYDDCPIAPGLYQARIYLTRDAYVAIFAPA